ncbi:MAG: glycosyltransferase [Prevotella sp.]|nr:glycosyltransferase [Prevotella sp.]
MKLSIVIPVYKTERTLRRCVESVLEQRFRDYQLILVDDCSPDSCPQLCDQLAQEDRRVQVVHRQTNGGLSEARNSGIEKARGEYITFVDSDDFLGKDTLKPLMDLLAVHHDYDLLEYSVHEHYGRPKGMTTLRLENREYDDIHQYWYEGKAYQHSYAWNKIYRRELFRGVRFPAGRKFEDMFTLPLLLEKCQMVATTSEGYYYYCYNQEGITVQADGNDMNDLLEAHRRVLLSDETSPLHPATQAYYSEVLNIAIDVYEMTGDFPDLPPLKQVCKVEKGEKVNVKIRLLKLLGLKNLCRILKLVHKIVRHSR